MRTLVSLHTDTATQANYARKACDLARYQSAVHLLTPRPNFQQNGETGDKVSYDFHG